MSNNDGNGNNNYNQNLQRQIQISDGFNTVALREEDVTFHPCSICLETPAYAISFCGHLYCWPCIYQWMASRPRPCLCPICQSVIGYNTLIAINGSYDDNRFVSAILQGLERVTPLHPALLPREEERFGVEEFVGYPYLNMIILFLMLYFIVKSIIFT